MNCRNRCLAVFLSFVILVGMPIKTFAVDNIKELENIRTYSVPVVSNEYSMPNVTFYELEGKYYLSLNDIKQFTRFELKETDTTITLKQGLRELVIEKKSGHLIDCGYADQGNIDIVEYNGKYLCEGIPMLRYLGAECVLKENQAIEVMMPTITIWESIMPDYLDYNFDIIKLYGGEDNVKISLTLDILADLLDGISGHGLFFTSSNTYLEDALKEILKVDPMKYESVQELMADQNSGVYDFLASEGVSDYLDNSSSVADSMSEFLDHYADFYLNDDILKNEVLWSQSYHAGDLKTASELSKEINQKVYEQSVLKMKSNYYKSAGSLLEVGAIALDTAITSHNLMKYDDDTRTLFNRTINEEVLRFAECDDISWKNISDKISKNLKNDRAIIASTARDNVVDHINDKLTKDGVQITLSAFTSKANIYTSALELSRIITSAINQSTFQAFSSDRNALYLSDVQNDIAQLSSRIAEKVLKDEKYLSDEGSLTKLKDMFALYYRTTIAFSENIAKSIKEFNKSKNGNEWVQYFSGSAGKSVSNIMAMYLYRITNCTIVPIADYSSKSDDLLSEEWIEKFQFESGTQYKNKKDYIVSYREAFKDAESHHLLETAEKRKYDSSFYDDASIPYNGIGYTLCDITGDGVKELIVEQTVNKHGADIWIYSLKDSASYLMGETGGDTLDYIDVGYAPGYIYESGYKGVYDLIYREWNGSEFIDSALYEGTWDYWGKGIGPSEPLSFEDLEAYYDKSRITDYPEPWCTISDFAFYTEEHDAEFFTGEGVTALYKPILDMYLTGINSNWAARDDKGTDDPYDPDSVSYMWPQIKAYTSSAGYLMRDLNHDGIPELLISSVSDASYGEIMDLYTIYNNQVVHLASNGGTHYSFYLGKDDLVMNHIAAGATVQYFIGYRIVDGELSEDVSLIRQEDNYTFKPAADMKEAAITEQQYSELSESLRPGVPFIVVPFEEYEAELKGHTDEE